MMTKTEAIMRLIKDLGPQLSSTMYQIIQRYPELPRADDGSFLMSHRDFLYHTRDEKVFWSHIGQLVNREYIVREKLKDGNCWHINWTKLA